MRSFRLRADSRIPLMFYVFDSQTPLFWSPSDACRKPPKKTVDDAGKHTSIRTRQFGTNPVGRFDFQETLRHDRSTKPRRLGDCLLQSVLFLPADRQLGRFAHRACASILTVLQLWFAVVFVYLLQAFDLLHVEPLCWKNRFDSRGMRERNRMN